MAGRPKGGVVFGPREDAYLETLLNVPAPERPDWRDVARALGRPELELLRRVATLRRRRSKRRAQAKAEADAAKTRPCACCGRPFVRTAARRMLCRFCYEREHAPA